MIKLLILLTIFNPILKAEESIHLNKDQPAPFEGFLITPNKVNDFKQLSDQRDTYKKLNDSLNTSLNLQADIIKRKDDQITLTLEQNDKLAKAITSSQTVNDITKIGLFILGVGTTIAVVYVAKKTAQ